MRNLQVSHLIVAGVLIAGVTIVPAEGALAAHTEPESTHCAIRVFPLGDVEHSTPETVCFATVGEVERYLSAMGEVGVGARAEAANVAVGTVYKDAGGAGDSLTFWGSSGCAGVTFGFPTVPSGWDNSISSVRGVNTCWVTAYADANYGGSRVNCSPYCASMGARNDSVRSLVFRPTGTAG